MTASMAVSMTGPAFGIKETLHDLMWTAASELFEAYGVPCERFESFPPADARYCGILGFTGSSLCGSVVIAATSEAVASSNPLHDGATPAWVGELTNQLVGRFKNLLLKLSVDVAISIPVVLTAVRIVPVTQRSIEPLQLNVGAGTLTIWVEYDGTPVFRDPTQRITIVEGDVMLF